MSDLLPIYELTEEQVRLAARDALESDDPYDAAADFAASVDWSFPDIPRRPEVVELVGELLQITTEYEEGDRTFEQLKAALEEMARPVADLERRREAGD